VERFVDVADGIQLWVEVTGDPTSAPPVLLLMGANASALAWPEPFVARLAERHPVVRYDHRDTGQSTWAFDERPYALQDLASDAVAVLDALGVERAHVVGMSLGGVLVQLLLLDHPDRLATATIFGTGALGDDEPVAIDPRLLDMWEHLADARSREEEIDWRVEHWRLLNGPVLPFDAGAFGRLEERIIDHAGRHDTTAAHARASQDGLDRGDELVSVRTPTLVVAAPADPLVPSAASRRLAEAIPGAKLVTIPGMGHAIGNPVVAPLADAVLAHVER
jgi:pimeloyl-ACP methyl ester carboxylesterase